MEVLTRPLEDFFAAQDSGQGRSVDAQPAAVFDLDGVEIAGDEHSAGGL